MNEQQYDKKDLKILALTERVAQLTADYEDKIADLRVELTIRQAQDEAANAETSPQED